MKLDGVGYDIENVDTDFDTTTFTISCWIKTGTIDYNALIFPTKSGYKLTGVELGIDGTSKPYSYIYGADGSYWQYMLLSDTSLRYNTYDHFVTTRESSNIFKMFINGIKVDEVQGYNGECGWDNTSSNPFTKLRFGYYDLSDPQAEIKTIDDFVMTKEVLYTENFTVPDRPIKNIFPNATYLIDFTQTKEIGSDGILKVY